MATTPVKKHHTKTLKDLYRLYKIAKKKEGFKIAEIIEYAEYKRFTEAVLKGLSEKMIYDNETVILPNGLGSIFVKSYKTNLKHAKVDFHLTKKFGKVVKHLNTHSFGYTFGFKWDKSTCPLKNRIYYKFTAGSSKRLRELGLGSKGLSKHIKELGNDPNRPSYIRI